MRFPLKITIRICGVKSPRRSTDPNPVYESKRMQSLLQTLKGSHRCPQAGRAWYAASGHRPQGTHAALNSSHRLGNQKTKPSGALCVRSSQTIHRNGTQAAREDTGKKPGTTAGWPCTCLFFFFKIKSPAYKNIGSGRRKMHSVLFYHFAGGIDFILFPLAPDQARLLAGIFHYPVANIAGQSGRLTDLHSDPPLQQRRDRA